MSRHQGKESCPSQAAQTVSPVMEQWDYWLSQESSKNRYRSGVFVVSFEILVPVLDSATLAPLLLLINHCSHERRRDSRHRRKVRGQSISQGVGSFYAERPKTHPKALLRQPIIHRSISARGSFSKKNLNSDDHFDRRLSFMGMKGKPRNQEIASAAIRNEIRSRSFAKRVKVS